MRRIADHLRPRRRGRALVPAVIVAFLGTTALAWADFAGVIPWPWAVVSNPDMVRLSGGETLLDREDNKKFAFLDLPAGTYHVSGKLSSANTSDFNTDLWCSLYASAEGDPDDTVLDTAVGVVLAEGDEHPTSLMTAYVGGFSSIVEFAGDGRLWVQCTGTPTWQPDQDPTPDGPDGDEPRWVGVDATLWATRVSTTNG